ncbi:MAG: PhoI, partial [Thermoproteota archaeon]
MVVRWVKRYPVDSLQIYFAASMELQEELIIHGFQVPASRDGKIKTPLPIIYSNFRGWVKEPEPLTDERLIPPEWYGKRVEELGWIYLGTILVQRGKGRQRRNAFRLPQEEVYVD